MSFEERAKHHKKRQATYVANKASTGPQTPQAATQMRSFAEQEQVVDRIVPTNVMSIVMMPVTPAPPAIVICSILSSNSLEKKTESVT